MQDKIECKLYMGDDETLAELKRRWKKQKIAFIVATILITLFLSTMLNVAAMKYRLEKEKQATEWTQE